MAFDAALYRFAPQGWLDRRHATSRRFERAGVCATVEIRCGDRDDAPHALVGGSFVPDAGSRLRVLIAHSGAWERIRPMPCNGLLGRPLLLGLPEEFASGVEAVLTSDPHAFDAGCLTVGAGAYCEDRSTQVAFGLASELLKWILFHREPHALTADDLAARWRRLERAPRLTSAG